jgi:IclR family pca regulon transcriptional regulator
VSDLAAELDLARPTVHRILQTLEHLGYVLQTDNGYYLTPKVLDLGFGYISTRGFYGAAHTHLEKLAASINQAISITELVGSDLVYVGRIEVPKVIAYHVALGQRLPAHSTSPGRLLLSGLSDEELDRRLAMPSSSPIEPSVTKIRKQGWAITNHQIIHGYRALAAPIYDATETMVAAIGLIVHSSEISEEKMRDEILPQVLEAASRVTEDFVNMAKLPRKRVSIAERGYVTFTSSPVTAS